MADALSAPVADALSATIQVKLMLLLPLYKGMLAPLLSEGVVLQQQAGAVSPMEYSRDPLLHQVFHA